MWKYLHSRLPVIMYKYVRWRGEGEEGGGEEREGKGREGEGRGGEGGGERGGEGRGGEGRGEVYTCCEYRNCCPQIDATMS